MSHSFDAKGIKEDIELDGDGTYHQKITDPKGKIYVHSGNWEKYTEMAGPPGVPHDGSQVQLKGWQANGTILKIR